MRLPGNNPETDSDKPTFQHVFTAHATYQVTLIIARGPAEDRKSTTFTVTPPARRLNCDDVITEDTVLAADLTCAGNGLTIAADDVTLDLAGHTITGSDTGTGIIIATGSATLLDGTIQEFATGILSSANSIDISRINLRANNPAGNALDLSGTGDRNFTITDSNIQWNGSIFTGSRFAATNLGSVTIVRTGISGGTTIGIGSGDFSITDSTLTDVQLDVRLLSPAVTTDGTLNLVGNTLTRSRIEVQGVRGTLRRNQISGSGSAVGGSAVWVVTSDDFQIIENMFTATGGISVGWFGKWTPNRIRFAGNTFRADGGISIDSAREVDISGNTFLGGGAGVWIPKPGVADLRVSGNVFRNNGSAGLYWAGTNGSGEIVDNIFENNGHDSSGFTDPGGSAANDGLHIYIVVPPGSSIVVARNHTSDNADFGIEAAPLGVQDGGGNTSIGDPNGCLGVQCG